MGLCPLGEVSGRMRWRSGGGGACMVISLRQGWVGGRDTKDTGEKGGVCVWCPTG